VSAPTIPQRLSFTIPGEAVPQGSMKAFTPKGWVRPVLTSDNKKTKPWRALVAAAALDAQFDRGTWPVMSTQAIRLEVRCYFVRPASVSVKKRPCHTVKPDVDKCLRSISDALTKILWKDDAQIASVTITKEYAAENDPARVVIHVTELVPAVTGAMKTRDAAASLPLD
jgi:Holliday junction resolvase RusA-like endonuclease